MPPGFILHVFHVYSSRGLLVYLSTCIYGRYYVMFEPRFPFDVYSMWLFYVKRWCTYKCVLHVILFAWINGEPIHVDINWIPCEVCHLILFHMISTCFFHIDY